MKFVIELNLEDGMVTEMTVTEDIEDEVYGCDFVDPNVDKPVDVYLAIEWIRKELNSYAK